MKVKVSEVLYSFFDANQFHPSKYTHLMHSHMNLLKRFKLIDKYIQTNIQTKYIQI